MRQEILAAALSAILPGVGQLYNHHWVKGVGFLAAVIITSVLIRRWMILEGPMSGLALLVTVILLGLAIWSVADAYRSARPAS